MAAIITKEAPASPPPRPVLTRSASWQLGYHPELDGLRAIAVLAVIGYHETIPYMWGGFFGVDVFFVLSGFLITSLLLQERARSGRINVARFYARRALRLFPALALLLVVLAAAGMITLAAASWVVAYAGNWVRAFGISSLGVVDHTWSLSVEEQFYLMWPALLILLLRLSWPVAGLLLVLLIDAVALHRSLLSMRGVSIERLYYALDTRLDGLFVGCLLAFFVTYGILHGQRWLRLASWPAAAFLLVIFARGNIQNRLMYDGLGLAGAVAAALVIASLVTTRSSALGWLLRWRPLVWVGGISYGVYLWHFPVSLQLKPMLPNLPVGLHALFMTGATLLIAAASYYALERPLLQLKARYR